MKTEGDISVIKTKAYLILELKCRLFSPKAYINKLNDKEDKNKFVVRMKQGTFCFANGKQVAVPYDKHTYLT